MITHNKNCRVCKGHKLAKVFSFGPTPSANVFLKPEAVSQPEYIFPLDVYFCHSCGLLQLLDIVSPEYMFRDYVYVSSTSPTFVKHFEDLAQDVYGSFNLDEKSLVIDIGSNDGILLKPFKKLGTMVLGIEPAKTVAKNAAKDGINTIPEFFSSKLSGKLAKKYGLASVITATNVFAHINDLDDFLAGVKKLLKKDGVFLIEVPYLVDFLKKNLFDTVYHEHLSYFSVGTLSFLFERLGMKIFDVQKTNVHGGTIRIFVKKNESSRPITSAVGLFIKKEKESKLNDVNTYLAFSRRIHLNKIGLVKMLTDLKLKGKKIAGYGAPGKGNTLLNYFSIGTDLLDYIVDDSPLKQGLYTPGKRIPVVGSGRLYKDKPDYLLIIAWNFAEPIMEKHSKFKKQGGRFIIPVPKPKIV